MPYSPIIILKKYSTTRYKMQTSFINLIYERNIYGNLCGVAARYDVRRAGRAVKLAFGRSGALGKNGADPVFYLRRMDGAVAPCGKERAKPLWKTLR